VSETRFSVLKIIYQDYGRLVGSGFYLLIGAGGSSGTGAVPRRSVEWP
jgi:hypothetical protein